MADFRAQLYERYASTYKNQISVPSSQAIKNYFRWCEVKFLPLFKNVPKNSRILELGCGTGNMLAFLKKHGFSNVSGIDISSEQIEIAVKQNLNARVADVFEVLKTSENEYDVIIALDFIEHFSKEELMQLIPILNHALAGNGRLILQTPNAQGLFPAQVIYGDLTHMTAFTPASLQQILRLWGFEQFEFFETELAGKDIKGRIRRISWQIIKLGLNLLRKIEVGKSQQIWTEAMICSCHKMYPITLA